MPLTVIGSGFGRTGTKSLKAALERLGFGPCHHMHEVMTSARDGAAVARRLCAGDCRLGTDVRRLLRHRSTGRARISGATWSRAFPEAKVIHSVRPEDKWWASYEKTIGKLSSTYADMPTPPHVRDMLEATFGAVRQTIGGDAPNRDGALAAFRRRTAEVTEALPPERVLVFDVAEGWGPLCRLPERRCAGRAVPASQPARRFLGGAGRRASGPRDGLSGSRTARRCRCVPGMARERRLDLTVGKGEGTGAMDSYRNSDTGPADHGRIAAAPRMASAAARLGPAAMEPLGVPAGARDPAHRPHPARAARLAPAR